MVLRCVVGLVDLGTENAEALTRDNIIPMTFRQRTMMLLGEMRLVCFGYDGKRLN